MQTASAEKNNVESFKSSGPWIRALWEEEDAQDLVEYSLLLAFIALAAVGLLGGVRTTVKGLFTTINTALSSASTTAS